MRGEFVVSCERCDGRAAPPEWGRAGASRAEGVVRAKTTRFDTVDYLDSDERQAAYITAALETSDADFVRDALGIVARERGMGVIARNAGLNRESLYEALGETGNPEFGTVMRIVSAMGLTLSARPRRRARRRRLMRSRCANESPGPGGNGDCTCPQDRPRVSVPCDGV